MIKPSLEIIFNNEGFQCSKYEHVDEILLVRVKIHEFCNYYIAKLAGSDNVLINIDKSVFIYNTAKGRFIYAEYDADYHLKSFTRYVDNLIVHYDDVAGFVAEINDNIYCCNDAVVSEISDTDQISIDFSGGSEFTEDEEEIIDLMCTYNYVEHINQCIPAATEFCKMPAQLNAAASQMMARKLIGAIDHIKEKNINDEITNLFEDHCSKFLSCVPECYSNRF